MDPNTKYVTKYLTVQEQELVLIGQGTVSVKISRI
jgi:hypothetical protein